MAYVENVETTTQPTLLSRFTNLKVGVIPLPLTGCS